MFLFVPIRLKDVNIFLPFLDDPRTCQWNQKSFQKGDQNSLVMQQTRDGTGKGEGGGGHDFSGPYPLG